jgi:hypothetical protein
MGRAVDCLIVTAVVTVRIAAIGGVSVDADRQETVSAALVTVVVDDRANVPTLILTEGEKEARRILRQAGVMTEWRQTPASVRGFAVDLIIRSTLTAPRMGRSRFVLGATPETARPCGGSSYVFYDQVIGLSLVERVDTAVVLGAAIAHEMGHLLLRRPGHSAEGLMRAPWNFRDWQQASFGWLLFSPRDAEAVHATIRSC